MPVINGTDGNDNLGGTSSDDTLNGLGGDDRLDGGDGNDVLNGGAGNDDLRAYAGADTLNGGDGNDDIAVYGGADGSTIDGGSGNDSIGSRANNVSIKGGSGDDMFWGAENDNTIDGGDGNDYFSIDHGPFNLVADGGAGKDVLQYSAQQPVSLNFTPGAAMALPNGTTAQNIEYLRLITGSGNNSVVFTNLLPTTTDVQFGICYWLADTGPGVDTLTVDESSNSLSVDFSCLAPGHYFVSGFVSTPSSYQSTGGFLDAINIDAFKGIGGGNNDVFYGGANKEEFIGNGGDDQIDGNAGDDILNGGAGNDTLDGGADEDRLTGGAGDDALDGGSSVDTAVVSGNRSAYTITQPSTGHFTVTGPDGTDTLTNVEYLKFDDQTMRLLPGAGTTVNFTDPTSTFMAAIRDFDGNDLGGAASWKLIGTADVNGDGRKEQVLFNREIGRWAEVGTEADGKTYFSNYNWAGDTRVVGIYIDPLVANGTVVKGSDTDSERRFQNDLMIDNIKNILGFGDYNHDGLEEVYFSLTDGTAYLHAYMHADGNIQYTNYQNKQQVIDYLTTNGVASSTWSTWFPASQVGILAAVTG